MHCHLDRYPDPRKIAGEAEQAGVTIVAVTNLPSHFLLGKEPASTLTNVRLSLGLHPLLAPHSEREKSLFAQLVPSTSYIGEVGLDFSRDGNKTKDAQIASFEFVLEQIARKGKIISIHSRRAEEAVLTRLQNYSISAAAFHWFSGTEGTLQKIVNAGHFLSINSAMLTSARTRLMLARVPPSCFLLETDGPYTTTGRQRSRPVHVHQLVSELSGFWRISIDDVHEQIASNFRTMLRTVDATPNLTNHASRMESVTSALHASPTRLKP
jgi:TatD DNase family protein